MKTVYLAGPVVGYTYDEAHDWREDVKAELNSCGIQGINPLRCEPDEAMNEDGTYQIGYDDPRFGTAKAISSKNDFDTRNCDMILAYIPKPKEGQRHSWGTMGELAGGHFLNKPTILVSDDEAVLTHPVLSGWSSFVLTSLDQAVDVCIGILQDYEEI